MYQLYVVIIARSIIQQRTARAEGFRYRYNPLGRHSETETAFMVGSMIYVHHAVQRSVV